MIPRTAISLGYNEFLALFRKISTNKVIEGEDIQNFEKKLAEYLGVQKTFTFGSGRTALYVALKALNLRKNDEIIVPAYTCAIVIEVILRLGLKPIFIDVNLETYNLDIDSLREVIGNNTKAIIPIHLFGRPCEMDNISEIAGDLGLKVIEDAAQALGAEYKGKRIGTMGNLGVFSFGLGKCITGGNGGAVSVNDHEILGNIELAKESLPNPDYVDIFNILKNIFGMKIFRNPHFYALIRNQLVNKLNLEDNNILENCVSLYKGGREYLHPTIRFKKMSNLSATITNIQLTKVDEFNKKRIHNSKNIIEYINDSEIKFQKVNSTVKNIFSRLALRVPLSKKRRILEALCRNGIDFEEPYSYIDKIIEIRGRNLPNAKILAQTLITVPNYPGLKETELKKIAKVVSSIKRGNLI